MSSKISIETKKPKFHKSLKLRIFPTENQKVLINKTFGCCRQIYNNRLEEKQEFYINSILPVKNKITKEEKKELYKTFKPSTEKELALKFPYMKEVSSSALQQARMNCETAYKNFFQSLSGKRKGRKVGFPNYKSKKDSRQSYREPQPKLEHFDFDHRTIKIPKLGKVYFKSHELPKWYSLVKDICNLTIEKSSSGNYYCVVLFELKELFLQRAENRKNSIGLDFSPKNCYIDSDGKSGKDFGYVAQKQKAHKKLQKLQRKVNRQMLRPFVEKYGRYPNWKSSTDKINFKLLCKEQGFKNLAKTRTKLAKVSEKVTNKRMEWIEKETLRLIKNYDKVVVEDLNLQGMSKFLTNAKNMTDTSWGTFVSKLQDKGKTFGCEIIKADKYFPSSKLCHVCGWKYEKLQLSERRWICPECGTNHNRDHNAAINLKNYIPAEHGKSTAGEFDKNSETSERVVSQLTSLALGTDAEPANQKVTTGRNPIGLSLSVVRIFNNNYILNLQSMSKMGFGKSVLNNGFGKFRTRLECKMKENLKTFVKADKWFPSSQICNNCGFRNPITKDLSVREYVCPHCGKHIYRDINASENLAKYCTTATVGSACGGKCQTCKLDFCLIFEQFPVKQEKLLHKKQ